MATSPDKAVRSTQEQAVAAWITHVNQVRLDGLLRAFRQQDVHLADALANIDAALGTIDLDVIATNRGGVKGMHGFIAEVAEVGVGNARARILGGESIYQWVNDNGPVDLQRTGVDIQQKFVAAGGRLGLGAVAEHLQKYPDFLKDGGKYQIPADHFERIRNLYEMSAEDAGKLTRSGDGPSFRDWQRVQTFFGEGSVSIDAMEPSHLEYHEVQRGAYGSTLAAEKESLRSTDESLRHDAYVEHRPSLQEGAEATMVAATIESGTAFILAVSSKRREGKSLREFTAEDWNDVAGATGFGAFTGGVRGASIYALTNFTATPAAVASSIVTAGFGIAAQANKLRSGEIDEQEFIENAELVSLEAAVSALSSFAGQALIPVPVLGAVIGNTVGTLVFSSVTGALNAWEAEMLMRHLAEQHELDEHLAAEHRELLDLLETSMPRYLDALDLAFSPDPEIALAGSVELALQLGVEPDSVLDTNEKALSYFLD